MNAPRRLLACAVSSRCGTAPEKRTRPLCSSTTWSSARDLVDQVGRPQHADAAFPDQRADDREHALARRDVEADGRLVEQQAGRLMQQCARDLDPARLAARERPHLVVGAIGKSDLGQRLARAGAALAPAHALQRGVIGEVLRQRQIAVETAALEHDAELPQRRRGVPAHVVAEDADLAADIVVEARRQGEQRRLAGAVRPEQHDEARRAAPRARRRTAPVPRRSCG